MIMLRHLLLLLIVPIAGECLSHDRYIINVDLPADIVQDVAISDTIPGGLIYENDSLNITGASDLGEKLSGPNDGSRESIVTWSIGRVNNTLDRDLQISFDAVVANVPGNYAGVTLHPNKATLRWRDSQGIHSSSDEAVPVEIVEPDLTVEKRIVPESCHVGDNISCIISFCHSSISSSDAFDADLREYMPAGLSFVPGSMKILTGPSGIMDDSSSSMLIWHFSSIDSSWRGNRAILVEYNATVQKSGPYLARSTLTWTSASARSIYERNYSAECECSLKVEEEKKGLSITKIASGQAKPGSAINYTISYENRGPTAHNAIIREVYDNNITFLSSNPPPDVGTEDAWTIGDLQPGSSGRIDVSAQVKPLTKEGTILDNIVKLTSDESNVSSQARTIVMENGPSLEISAASSSDFIRPGDNLDYTIAFKNDGPGDAVNISITDIIDSHLLMVGSTPEPTKIWSDSTGTHLFWNAADLNTSILRQGESGEISLKVGLPSVPAHPDIDSLYNIYRIDSDNAEGKQGSLKTFVIHSLFVRKKADKDACSEGEVVNYTITYGNELAISANNAVITDRLVGMDYVYAVPVPKIKGDMLTWKLGTLKPHSEGSIRLCARIRRRSEIHLQDAQLISGEGYVASSLKLSASPEPHEAINYVNITASYKNIKEGDSSSAKIRLLDISGAGIESAEKGSGSYAMDRTIDYRSGKSLKFNKEISATYSPVIIPIAQNSLTENSLWEDRTKAENGARNEVISKNYRYMSHLDDRTSFLMDKNQTVFSSRSSSGGGIAQMNYQREASGSIRDAVEIAEEYFGSSKIESRLDSYGSQAVYSRSVSGSGFESSDVQASGENASIRSNEHGSGLYESSETITNDPISLRSMNLSYASFDWSAGDLKAVFADKWSEGMSVENPEAKSRIGEKISLADHIQNEALMDSLSLAMTSEFSGTGSLWSSAANGSVNVEEVFAGKYRINTAIGIFGLIKHMGPHLSLTKEALRLDSKTVLFRINVTNDGSKSLAPVEIMDILPENMTFFNSSYRPMINGRNINWSLISLAPGTTKTLDLRVKLNGALKWNRVKAIGHYKDEAVKAEASCGAFFQPYDTGQLSQYNATADWCALPECADEWYAAGDNDIDYYANDDSVLCASCV